MRNALEQKKPGRFCSPGRQSAMMRSLLRQKGTGRPGVPDGQKSESRRSESVKAVPWTAWEMSGPRAAMACCLSNCSTPIYFYGKTLTFRIETGRQLERRDTGGMGAEAQNVYDCLLKDQAVHININSAIHLPTFTAGFIELPHLTLKLWL